MVDRTPIDITPKYKPNKYRELRSKLVINEMGLNEELMQQPNLVQDIGENLAMCIHHRDMLAQELKKVIAIAAGELRYGKDGKKVSEAQVSAELDAQEDVLEAKEQLEAAKLDAALWGALIESAKTKTSALKHMSELTVSGWLTPNSAAEGARRGMGEDRAKRRANGGY